MVPLEGRDEPIVNKDHNASQSTANASAPNSSSTAYASAAADSSSGPHHHQHQNPYFQQQNHHSFGRPPMNFSDEMDFGDMQMPHGSIFEKVKEFPVRADFPDFFNVRTASPNRRSESPINQHHYQQQPRKSPSGGTTNPVSGDRQVPVQQQHDAKRASTPQRHQTPPPKQTPPPQQSQNVQEPVPVEVPQNEQQTEEQRMTAARQKAIEDSITKIQRIQQSVLELMGRVEQYDGIDRKEYMFLDEMLTQNLIKLDDIDAEGKDNIKNARREAIKCINSLISLLEAKNDEVSAGNNNNNDKSALEKSKSNEEANKNVEQTPSKPQDSINGASKNSSYDNVNVQHTEVPSKSAEENLQEKVAKVLIKQEVDQKQT